MKLFSFFAGAGFLDLGFESEGFETVFVNELHKPFLDAYKYSRQLVGLHPPQYGYFNGDVEHLLFDYQSEKLSKFVKDAYRSNQPIGFIGGPPCPDFSIGGKNRGRDGDNGKLSASYVKLICQQKPDFFLFENVKGLWRTKRHRAFYEELKAELHNAGYYTSERLINAIEYGVGQDRARIILIGFRPTMRNYATSGVSMVLDKGQFDWLGSTLYPDRTAFNNYDWPIQSDFEENSYLEKPPNILEEVTVEYWFQQNDVNNHPNAQHAFTPRSGLPKFQTIDEGDNSKKSYKRLHRWRFSPTAAYGNNEVHLHPYKARRISAAEALAIQSLPKSYALPSNMTLTNMFKSIGNGVPFLAAKGIAKSIKSFLGEPCESNSIKFSESNWQSAQEPLLQLYLK